MRAPTPEPAPRPDSEVAGGSPPGDIVELREIEKLYRIGVGRARVREMLPWPMDQAVRRMFPKWWLRNTFKALDDVSLSVAPGTSLGIVGHNGAGKTTLLKVIAGVTAPSFGSVKVSGRIAALIDLLVGFNLQLTGRENVSLLGAIHGFPRRAMAEKAEQIFDFAEIDDLIDTPVKRYSAGMAARLGFATITALEADILLIDEVLAVGDAAFQRKCIGWLDDYRSRGGTLLFVSHNLGLVRNMTERLIWLERGRIVDDGPTRSVLGHYGRALEHRDHGAESSGVWSTQRIAETRGLHRWGAGGARIARVHFEEEAQNGDALRLDIEYEVEDLREALMCVALVGDSGQEIGAATSPQISLAHGKGKVQCDIHKLPLRSGIYFPVVAILSPDGKVRDRWRLDRAVVIDHQPDLSLQDTFGPVEFTASWSGL